MQDPSDPLENSEPEVNGRSDTAELSGAADPAPDSGSDSTAASTVRAKVPPELPSSVVRYRSKSSRV